MLRRRDFFVYGLTLTASLTTSDTVFAELPILAKKPISRFSLADAKRTIELLEPLHEHKKPPQPGEWLDVYGKKKEEQGQTFEEYVRGSKRTIEQYSKLYLLPLGTFSEVEQKLIDLVVEGMTCFFGLPTIQLKADPLTKLPASAERIGGAGPASDSEHLSNRQDTSSQKTCGCSSVARANEHRSLARRGVELCVWPGIARHARRRLVLRALRQLGRHGSRTATLFSSFAESRVARDGPHVWHSHCAAYECGMNGSNSLPESDRQVLEFCPECQAKIWWTNDYTPKKRCAAMLEYCKKAGLVEEAKYYTGLSAVL